eukprot:SAG31_NODE_5246_length_2652_cov_2.610262_2_plen_257_part_00
MTTSGQAVAGGAVAVMNGTGAGQVRRIVEWQNVSLNPTIMLDTSFDPPLDNTSFVTVSPYWGHIIWDNVTLSDGGHFQLYGAVFDSVIHAVRTYRLGGIMVSGFVQCTSIANSCYRELDKSMGPQGLGGGPWFEPNHRIEISDCFVESHWGSGGFIDGGGVCGGGNCSLAQYWVLKNNRGGYGADISIIAPNSINEGNTAHSCCADMAKGCQVGAQAGLATVDILSSYPKFAFIANLVNRQNINNNSCPKAPTGPE